MKVFLDRDSRFVTLRVFELGKKIDARFFEFKNKNISSDFLKHISDSLKKYIEVKSHNEHCLEFIISKSNNRQFKKAVMFAEIKCKK